MPFANPLRGAGSRFGRTNRTPQLVARRIRIEQRPCHGTQTGIRASNRHLRLAKIASPACAAETLATLGSSGPCDMPDRRRRSGSHCRATGEPQPSPGRTANRVAPLRCSRYPDSTSGTPFDAIDAIHAIRAGRSARRARWRLNTRPLDPGRRLAAHPRPGRRAARRSGWEVRRAGGGQEALALVRDLDAGHRGLRSAHAGHGRARGRYEIRRIDRPRRFFFFFFFFPPPPPPPPPPPDQLSGDDHLVAVLNAVRRGCVRLRDRARQRLRRAGGGDRARRGPRPAGARESVPDRGAGGAPTAISTAHVR